MLIAKQLSQSVAAALAHICDIVIPNTINMFNFIWPGFAPAEYPVYQSIVPAMV